MRWAQSRELWGRSLPAWPRAAPSSGACRSLSRQVAWGDGLAPGVGRPLPCRPRRSSFHPQSGGAPPSPLPQLSSRSRSAGPGGAGVAGGEGAASAPLKRGSQLSAVRGAPEGPPSPALRTELGPGFLSRAARGVRPFAPHWGGDSLSAQSYPKP